MPRVRSFMLATIAVVASLAFAPVSSQAATINLPLPLPTGCVDAVVLQINCAPKTGTPICKDAALQPDGSNGPQIRAATLCLLNLERTTRHLPKLQQNSRLASAARSYAAQLVRQHFFEHTAPDGTTMLARIRRTAYLAARPRLWWVGENLAYGTGYTAQPAQIVNAWMNSPGHRANILNSRYREIGLGISMGNPSNSDGATYVTDFGRRIR